MPPVNEIVHYLVTGVVGGVEGSFDVDGVGPNGSESLVFDGVDDLVDYGANPALNWAATDSFTYEFWVQVPPGETDGMIISQRSVTDHRPVLNIGLGYDGVDNTGTGTAGFLVRAGETAPFHVHSATAINDGVWHHVAAVRDGSTRQIRLFVDGVMEAEAPEAMVLPITTDLRRIGNEGRWSLVSFGTPDQRFLTGTVDEVRVWELARTEAEIQAAMNACLVGTEVGLIAYWRFDEVSGQVVTDSSAGGNDGTLGLDASPANDDPMNRPGYSGDLFS